MGKNKIKKVNIYEGTIVPLEYEKEYPHIIKELDENDIQIIEILRGNANKELMNKINEIIKVINIMNRGGRKYE